MRAATGSLVEGFLLRERGIAARTSGMERGADQSERI
jgi:hypothetical protein